MKRISYKFVSILTVVIMAFTGVWGGSLHVSDNDSHAAATAQSDTSSSAQVTNLDYDESTGEVNAMWTGDADNMVVELYSDKADNESDYDNISKLDSKTIDLAPIKQQIADIDSTNPLELLERATASVKFDNMPTYFVLKAYLTDSSGNKISEVNEQYFFTKEFSDLNDRSDEAINGDNYTGNGRLVTFKNATAAVTDDSENGYTTTPGAVSMKGHVVLKDDVVFIEEIEGSNATSLQVEKTGSSSFSVSFRITNADTALHQDLSGLSKGDPVFIADVTNKGTSYHTVFANGPATASSGDLSLTATPSAFYADISSSTSVNSEDASKFFSQAIIHSTYVYNTSCDTTISGIDAKFKLKGTFQVFLGFKTVKDDKGEDRSALCFSPFHRAEFQDVSFRADQATTNIPPIPIYGFYLDVGIGKFNVGLNFKFQGTMKGEVSFDLTIDVGIEVGINSRLSVFANNLSDIPYKKFNRFTLESDLFMGISLDCALKGYKEDDKDVPGASAALLSGFHITGGMKSQGYYDNGQRYHSCKGLSCLEGSVSYHPLDYKVHFKLIGLINVDRSGTIADPIPICDWFFSFSNNDAGLTKCPYYGYRLKVTVLDQDGLRVTNAHVSYYNNDPQYKNDGQNHDLTTSVTGRDSATEKYTPAVLYVPKGDHSLQIKYECKPGQWWTSPDNAFKFHESGYNKQNQLVDPEYTAKINLRYIVYTFVDNRDGAKADNIPEPLKKFDCVTDKIPNNVPTKSGYTFIGWSEFPSAREVTYKPGETLPEGRGRYADDVTSLNLYAVWAYNKYNVSFDSNKPDNASQNISGEMSGIELNYNNPEKKKLPSGNYSLPGWEFTGWNTTRDGTGESYDDAAVVTNIKGALYDKVTLYAQWKPKTYTVNFDAGSGGTGTMAPQTLKYDSSESLKKCTFTNANGLFSHWSTLSLGNEYNDETIVHNLCTLDSNGDPTGYTLTANWLPRDNNVILRFNKNNKPLAISNPANDIQLQEFGTGGNAIYKGLFVSSSPNSNTVRFDRSATTTFPEGTYKILFAGALSGYDNGERTGGRTIEISSDHGTYNFNFCTMTISSEGHGTSWIGTKGSSHKDNVLVGNTVDIGSDADTGYHFDGYTALGCTPGWENSDNTAADQEIVVTGKTDIEAHFEPNVYTVLFHPNYAHSGFPDIKQDMVYDQPQKLFTNHFSRRGYDFVGWTHEPTWNGNTSSVTTAAATSNKLYTDAEEVMNLTAAQGATFDLYAQYSPVSSFLKYHPNGGSGLMLDQKVFFGTKTNLMPNEFELKNYVFAGWNTSPDGTGTSYSDEQAYISDNAVANSTIDLYAQWKPKEYKITYKLNGGNIPKNSTPNPAVYTCETESFTLSNPVRKGYKFTGWKGSGLLFPSKHVTITKGTSGDLKYTATWKKASPYGSTGDDSRNALLLATILMTASMIAAISILLRRRKA